MLQPSEPQTVPSAVLLAALTQLFATGGPWNVPTMQLWQNNITPTRGTVYGDFDIADFSGYADVVGVVFEGPYYDSDGSALMIGADWAFISTDVDPFVPNVIFGYLLANAGLTSLITSWRFTDPVAIDGPFKACPVAPFVRYSGT